MNSLIDPTIQALYYCFLGKDYESGSTDRAWAIYNMVTSVPDSFDFICKYANKNEVKCAIYAIDKENNTFDWNVWTLRQYEGEK